jgi:hypothetical protein
MADAIGSLFIDLSMQTASFDAATKRVETQVRGLTTKIQAGFGALKGALAATGLVLAAQQVYSFGQSMAQAGEDASNLATTLGLTLQKVVELQGVFRLTTGSLGEAQAAMLKMNGAVADARAGQETAIANFKAIGVSLEDLARVGSSPSDMLKLLADRFTAYQDNADKSAAFFDIFGKGWSRLAPALSGGAAEIDRLIARLKELDPAGQDAAKAGDELDKKLDELNTSVQGLANQGFVILNPLFLEAATNALTFVTGLRQTIVAANDALGPLGGLVGLMRQVSAWGDHITKTLPGQMAQATRNALGLPLIPPAGVGIEKARVPIPPDPGGGPLPGIPEGKPAQPIVLPTVGVVAKGGGGGGGKKKGGGGGGKDEALEEWKESVEAMKDLADEAADAARQLAEHTKDIGDELFNRRLQQIRHELDIEKITGQQAIDAERRVAGEKWLAHQDFYNKKREAAEGDKKKIDEINQQEKVAYEQHLTEMEKFAQDKVKLRFDDLKDAARDLGNVLENSFSNAFDGITEGTFKLRTAIGGLLKDLGRMIANKAFQMLLNGGSSSSSGGGILGSLIGKAFGMFTGGGGTGPFGDNWSAAELGMPALASGGSFRVGGSGGIDSQLIAARMTPGELVEVTPPGQAGGMGGSEVIRLEINPNDAFIAGIADQQITTRSGTIIQVAEARAVKSVQRNWSGMSGEASQRQL